MAAQADHWHTLIKIRWIWWSGFLFANDSSGRTFQSIKVYDMGCRKSEFRPLHNYSKCCIINLEVSICGDRQSFLPRYRCNNALSLLAKGKDCWSLIVFRLRLDFRVWSQFEEYLAQLYCSSSILESKVSYPIGYAQRSEALPSRIHEKPRCAGLLYAFAGYVERRVCDSIHSISQYPVRIYEIDPNWISQDHTTIWSCSLPRASILGIGEGAQWV